MPHLSEIMLAAATGPVPAETVQAWAARVKEIEQQMYGKNAALHRLKKERDFYRERGEQHSQTLITEYGYHGGSVPNRIWLAARIRFLEGRMLDSGVPISEYSAAARTREAAEALRASQAAHDEKTRSILVQPEA